jgi:hypothetical protein
MFVFFTTSRPARVPHGLLYSDCQELLRRGQSGPAMKLTSSPSRAEVGMASLRRGVVLN